MKSIAGIFLVLSLTVFMPTPGPSSTGNDLREFYLGAPACSAQQRAATCSDIVTGLQTAQSEGVKVPARLLELGPKICTAIGTSDNLTAKTLIADFLPLLDQLIASAGKGPGLALVDIAIHIVINHLPAAAPSIAAKGQSGAATDDASDRVLKQYRSRAVWGCSYHPEIKCRK